MPEPRRGWGATYRVQLGPGFGFDAAAEVVPYLAALGVECLYLSPVLEARQGSPHGYDVTDARALRRELGAGRAFRRLANRAHRSGLGVMLDIVPNHMAADGQNPWWRDVLEHGRASPYAKWFDIDWDGRPGGSRGRLLLPILGDDLRSILARGELRLGVDDEGLHLRYWEARFPLALRSYRIVLDEALAEVRRGHGPRSLAARDLAAVLESGALKRGLKRFREAHPEVERTLRRAFVRIVGGAALARRERLFDRILARQHYRLAFWKRGPREVNFRRFFNVADLVALRVERPEVFQARHALLFRLLREGTADALRVDHVDGLRDPETYLRRLRRRIGPARRMVVEKVLSVGEVLPGSWPVDGTTGYDYLAASAWLHVDPEGLESLRAGWHRFTGDPAGPTEVAREAKRQVAAMHFSGEVDALARRLAALARRLPGPELIAEDAREVLLATLAAFPVYRTYSRRGVLEPPDRRTVVRALRDGRRAFPGAPAAAWNVLRRVLLLDLPESAGRAGRADATWFVERWQLLTAPVHAKGIEDTAFYRYLPLAALNEVGSEPEVPGDPVAAFHRVMRSRLGNHPGTLNTTATHDTKRGEDVRARLAVLSEFPDAWWTLVRRWHRMNAGLRTKVAGREVPTPEEEVLFYQTLVGSWPAAGPVTPRFLERLKDYAVKAAREAKRATSWLDPDRDHEAALETFVLRSMRSSGRNPFLADVRAFQRPVARVGAWNGLSQVVLKAAAPGTPDVYQGAELWDLRLVDPDNRRPVDFRRLQRAAEDLDRRAEDGRERLVRALLERWEDGRIKTFVLRESLRLRRENPGLFDRGAYVPLRASAPRARHVVAFARRMENRWAVVVTPRLVAPWCIGGGPPVGERVWGDATLRLPEGAPERFRNALTGGEVATSRRGRGRRLRLAEALAACPVALLVEGEP